MKKLLGLVPLLVLFATQSPAQVIPLGGEFQVNTYTTGHQGGYVDDPKVAVDADGNFVVVWDSSGQDGSDSGAYGQRFAADGTKLGGEFQISKQTLGAQALPTIAMRPAGDFVVAWWAEASNGTFDVHGQSFNSNGLAVGRPFLVNTTTYDQEIHPEIAMMPGTKFAVVWSTAPSQPPPAEDWSIRARLFDPGAFITAFGSQFQVDTASYGFPVSRPDVAALNGGAEEYDGVFMVAWQGSDFGGNDTIKARLVHPDFQTLEFKVSDQSGDLEAGPSVAADVNGEFVIAWSNFSQGEVYAKRFDAGGNQIGGQFQINAYTTQQQDLVDVAAAENGDFVAVWRSFGQDGSQSGIQGRLFDSSGNPLTGEFQVNTYTTGNQYWPSVAMTPDGENFVVTWRSQGQDGSAGGVFGQRFEWSSP